MQYSLKFVRFWDHTLPDTKNHKPVLIILKSKDFEDDSKLECQEKHVDKIHA